MRMRETEEGDIMTEGVEEGEGIGKTLIQSCTSVSNILLLKIKC